VTLYKTKIAQVDYEIDTFIALLKRENVRSYLEIGSQYGGSLWKVANSLPVGSRIVSIDYPQGDHTAGPLKECVKELRRIGYDAHSFLGDSTSAELVGKAAALAPFDCVFIDGNHTYDYVAKDWKNYEPRGKIVALHDIAWDRPVRPGRLPIEVSKLWREIKGGYRHQEIIAPGSEKGIGVIWR
jgi:predicted O-methyltransferase YrrM